MYMDRAVIQLPLPISLKIHAQQTAIEQGFSSLQEFIRVILAQIVKKGATITIGGVVDEPVVLSAKAKKRYLQMEKDFRNNKNILSVRNVDELIKHLHAN